MLCSFLIVFGVQGDVIEFGYTTGPASTTQWIAWPKVDFGEWLGSNYIHWVEVTRVLPNTGHQWYQEFPSDRRTWWHVCTNLICRWTWGCTLLLAESQNCLLSLGLFNCHEANEDFQLAQYSLLVGKYSWNSLPRSLHMLQNWNHYESMSVKAGRKATKW